MISPTINSIRRTSAGIEIKCSAEQNVEYWLQATGGLRFPCWVELDEPAMGANEVLLLDTEPNNRARFYRVRADDMPKTRPMFKKISLGPGKYSISGRPLMRTGDLTCLVSSSGIRFWKNPFDAIKTFPPFPYDFSFFVWVWLSENNLWILTTTNSSFGPCKLLECEFSGTPLPETIRISKQYDFGVVENKVCDFIRTQDGSLIVVLQDVSSTSETVMKMWSMNGQTSELRTLPALGRTAHMALAQHPADDSIWLFGLKDGHEEIMAIRFEIQNNQLVKTWNEDRYLEQEGELAHLKATVDPAGNQLVVSRPIKPSHFYSTQPFRKGSPIGISFINVDKTKTDISWGNLDGLGLCESVSPHGLALDSNHLWIGCQTFNEATFAFDQFTVTRLKSGTEWNNPLLLGRAQLATNYRGGAKDNTASCYSMSLGPTQWLNTFDDNIYLFYQTRQ